MIYSYLRSKSETQGIVLLEAMAAENPVIAVDASGVCDVVCNGKNGYRTPEDAYVWARKIADTIGERDSACSTWRGRKTDSGVILAGADCTSGRAVL